MALTIRRGTSSRRMIVAAASGSVGDTTAPRTNAASQERPAMIACAAKATAHIVTSTSPTALRVRPRRLARRSLKFAKIADPYRSGGRKTTSTTSGSSFTSGSPGTNPTSAPPTTSTIGYGTDSRRASALRPATATSRPAIRISAWPIPEVCPAGPPARGYAPHVAEPDRAHVRLARHTERLDEAAEFYRDGIGLTEVGGFRGHDGYDGVFLAVPGTGAHLELTAGGGHGAPTPPPASLIA